MTKEQAIIDKIARLNSETWKDREDVRTEIGKLLSELKKELGQQPYDDCVSRQSVVDFLKNHAKGFDDAEVRMCFRSASLLVNNPDNIPPVTPTHEKLEKIDTITDGITEESNPMVIKWNIKEVLEQE